MGSLGGEADPSPGCGVLHAPPLDPDELVDMRVQYRQKPLEFLPIWLLNLWDVGVENIVISGTEMSRMASLITHPSLWQRLQNAHHTSGNQKLLEWLTAAIRVVWPNQDALSY